MSSSPLQRAAPQPIQRNGSRSLLKTVLATAALGLALLAGPPAGAQQGMPGPFNGAYAPQQQAAVSPQQFLLGTWRLGAEIATYLPNGMVNGVVHLRQRPKPMPFKGT